jgi:alkylhydroperoxidase family enzyme
MTAYPIHTVESAPESSKQSLETLHKAFGLIPNLAATMANAPSLVNTFVAAFGQLAGAGFTGGERQVLLLSNAVANNSSWPVAFHSTMALKEGVARTEIDAIRAGRTPADPRLAALSAVTQRLIETRGHLDEADVKSFLSAGFEPNTLLDVVAGLAVSTMANYTANVTDPELEPPFQAEAWSREIVAGGY